MASDREDPWYTLHLGWLEEQMSRQEVVRSIFCSGHTFSQLERHPREASPPCPPVSSCGWRGEQRQGPALFILSPRSHADLEVETDADTFVSRHKQLKYLTKQILSLNWKYVKQLNKKKQHISFSKIQNLFEWIFNWLEFLKRCFWCRPF